MFWCAVGEQTGWVNPTGVGWSDCFQALSHFSYHVTNGQHLLCDLQGK